MSRGMDQAGSIEEGEKEASPAGFFEFHLEEEEEEDEEEEEEEEEDGEEEDNEEEDDHGVSLREWLDKPERRVDFQESLHIFRQIVDMVKAAHDEGVVVGNVRPSCFVMSTTFNRVSFIESASCSGSDGDDEEDGESGEKGSHWDEYEQELEEEEEEEEEEEDEDEGEEEQEEEKRWMFPLKQLLGMELHWYTSPEEASGSPSMSFQSDIYRLGVLLFELLCPLDSRDEKLRNMGNLRHRVLPPQFLFKFPKEANFCLWLLHPQPSSRPKMIDVLSSEFLKEPKDSFEDREAAIKLRDDMENQKLLLEFLLLLQSRKQEVAGRLTDTISCISSDMEELMKQRRLISESASSLHDMDERSGLQGYDCHLLDIGTDDNTEMSTSRKRLRHGRPPDCTEEATGHLPVALTTGAHQMNGEIFLTKSSRLMKDFKKLESYYFQTRCRINHPVGKVHNRHAASNGFCRDSLSGREDRSADEVVCKVDSCGERGGWLNPFLDGLRKYLSFSRLKVRANIKQADLLNSSGVVCSLGFDRDKEMFATAGMNRKIKIFECDMVLNDDSDIHYPVVEMVSQSKLSSICWNGCIRSQIASSDFEGVVQVWDATRSQVSVEMREHQKRVWCVDFSPADPNKLASGSDDCTVKIWNPNQPRSVATLKTEAYVCSVQFPPDSGYHLAVGSANHKIYYYDLRNQRSPLSTLPGHSKTVSYVKFVDSSTLVSASTDNSLKLWDLSTSTNIVDGPVQTFTGHTNVKNFVGLTVSDGYIATGSETNEVFVYHKTFPMPMLSFKFDDDNFTSAGGFDEATQFVSSVCWRGRSSILVAANSSGCVKLLELV